MYFYYFSHIYKILNSFCIAAIKFMNFKRKASRAKTLLASILGTMVEKMATRKEEKFTWPGLVTPPCWKLLAGLSVIPTYLLNCDSRRRPSLLEFIPGGSKADSPSSQQKVCHRAASY